MNTLESTGTTFMIITCEFVGKGTDLIKLKKEAVYKSKWPKGVKRTYFLFLVQKDTEYIDGELRFTSELAAETALDLGEI